jgi:hypothetical protein
MGGGPPLSLLLLGILSVGNGPLKRNLSAQQGCRQPLIFCLCNNRLKVFTLRAPVGLL